MKVGILALQGAVQPHEEKLKALGVESLQVRYPEQLADLDGIILPGGESTTMIHLLRLNQLWNPLKEFVQTKPTWGICAGSILLAETVTHPAQESLAALKITIERNAYGRQNESFIDVLVPTPEWRKFSPDTKPLEGVFIRAPKIKNLTSDIKVIFEHAQEPVMIQKGKCLASTFHPELTDSTLIHEYFLSFCGKDRA
jgi:5'-phosphate synthase pdxT subunit